MARRRVWDDRQGDLFGMPAPGPSEPRSRSSGNRPLRPESPIYKEVTFSSLAKRATRPDMDDLVSEMEDADLAYLTVGGVRALKRRLARGRQGRSGNSKIMSGGRKLERALQEIATELAELESPDDVW